MHHARLLLWFLLLLCPVCSVLQWWGVFGGRSHWPVWTITAWTRSSLIKFQCNNHVILVAWIVYNWTASAGAAQSVTTHRPCYLHVHICITTCHLPCFYTCMQWYIDDYSSNHFGAYILVWHFQLWGIRFRIHAVTRAALTGQQNSKCESSFKGCKCAFTFMQQPMPR